MRSLSVPRLLDSSPAGGGSTKSGTLEPRGFAVVDLETTGIHYGAHHRIIEIGLVLLDSSLNEELRWETLINPNRDIGSTRVHGIRARDVLDAPEFPDVAPELMSLLDGRIVVAHNAVFDTGFLASEFGRTGMALSDLARSSICTMRLAPRVLGPVGRDLASCCAHAGIVNERAHAALSDAEATATLFRHMSTHPDFTVEVSSRVPLTCPLPATSSGPSARPLKRRPIEFVPEQLQNDWIGRIAVTMPRIPVGPAEECYLAVLDRALADRMLSRDEKDELVGLATALSLTQSTVLELHARYLASLTALALADGIVTDEEHRELTLVATQLGLTPPVAADPPRRAAPSAPSATESSPSLELAPGDRVTFTGEMAVPREEWERRAAAKGLDVGGVRKSSRLLVAADPDSLSGKAKKARDYNVPVVDEATFARLLGQMS